ncbi:hypothetical protein GCM10023115_20940 [Pontixanthobacter gangjinensis]|uniref:Phosphatidate cytidylyltransferase n=1 Tax=Pontixanthobacter gangjinensis TaxID=1028742 RepID=A0A6I4SS60_9SPHN|nr:phosphatidate cytidylyltransferase [Pontixanthobacter gangjinensis]MXO57342.1 phosphatidate cytidylyltransferase [Pontixanthobacter gangjinensis]
MISLTGSGVLADGEATKKKSDLPVRFASAIVMLVICGFALLRGGNALLLFILIVTGVALLEYLRLVVKAFGAKSALGGALFCFGVIYFGLAAVTLGRLPSYQVAQLIGIVAAVDVFAYFFGRTIGGPKIAPKISPSKTWAGYIGGSVGASIVFFFAGSHQSRICESLTPGFPSGFDDRCHFADYPMNIELLVWAIVVGLIIAAIAQSGDFFESWLKRRAGMKDSSRLIPGHGGVLDRVDGLVAVTFVIGAVGLIAS